MSKRAFARSIPQSGLNFAVFFGNSVTIAATDLVDMVARS
jgi:hypothetical protein